MRLSGCKRDLESGGERGVGAEVERVRRRGGRLEPEKGIGGRIGRSGDPDLLARFDLGPLRGGDARRPADCNDLRPCERHAGKRREGGGADRGRRVVGRANTFEREDGGGSALLERCGRAVRPLACLLAHIVLLDAPERQRQRRGCDGADEESEWESEASRHRSDRVFGLTAEDLSLIRVWY